MGKEIAQRRELRGQLAMPGVTRDSKALRRSVAITDLSAHGCRILLANGEIEDNVTSLFIHLDNLSPQRAYVRWRDQRRAGLEFEKPLYQPVVDHLLAKWRLIREGQVLVNTAEPATVSGEAISEALDLARAAHRARPEEPLATLNRRPGLGYRMIFR